MILKKPYAFFIKNFKLFHFIIFAIASILLYRTSLIYDFLKVYNKTNPNLIGKELTGPLFSPWLYILIALLIIINVIIITVLIKKEKPYLYYILNITLYVVILLIYIAAHSTISNLETQVVAAKVTLAIRDITNIARMLQTVSVIFYLIRATGFDMKKFDFVRDLQGLDISEEDSEEIEVAVEFEKNLAVRNIKKNLRNAKYYYQENKFIINVITALFIGVVCLAIYFNINKYDRVYKENEFVNANAVTIGVKETNVVTKNYKNKSITDKDKALVVVKVSVRGTGTLQTARTVLTVNGMKYYNASIANNALIDLGNIYKNETLTSDFTDYLLIYQIPEKDIKSKMTFKYIDNVSYKRGRTKVDSLDITLNPKYPEETEENIQEYQLNNEISSENYKINITNYELKERFENAYRSCVNANECYDFKEILYPSVMANQDKALLKIEGNFEYENKIGDVGTLYKFIEKYATIEYTYNGETHTETEDFSEVTPARTKEQNVYYIEVNKDILNADSIKITFSLRNNIYKYILRGEVNE